MPVEDRFGDVRGEIAEADAPSEIGRAHAFPLGKRSKGNVVAADEGRVKPARPDQQLDHARWASAALRRQQQGEMPELDALARDHPMLASVDALLQRGGLSLVDLRDT